MLGTDGRGDSQTSDSIQVGAGTGAYNKQTTDRPVATDNRLTDYRGVKNSNLDSLLVKLTQEESVFSSLHATLIHVVVLQ